METITIKPLAELLGVNWQTVEIGTCRVPRVGGVDKEMDKRKAIEAMADYFDRKARENAKRGNASNANYLRRYRQDAVAWRKRWQRAMALLQEECI